MYDCAIIGGGPAGIAAGIYASRLGLKNILFEKAVAGGQALNAFKIDNYPGLPAQNGADLIIKMFEHLKLHETEIIYKKVLDISLGEDDRKKIICEDSEFEARSVIITTGAKQRRIGVPGEGKFLGRGVSYCATCDAVFFRGKKTAVLGNGSIAAEDAIFLSRFAREVLLISPDDSFSFDLKKVDIENVSLLYNLKAKEIVGEKNVEKIILKTGGIKEEIKEKIIEIEVDGIFSALGVEPGANFLDGVLNKDPGGYIITDQNMNANIKGIFAAGDARATPLRQVLTAASDGATAAFSASLYA